jgi:hypothetical protein
MCSGTFAFWGIFNVRVSRSTVEQKLVSKAFARTEPSGNQGKFRFYLASFGSELEIKEMASKDGRSRVFHSFIVYFLFGALSQLAPIRAMDDSTYQIGIGIADITGPAAEINMMGYAKYGQDTAGIHFRLRSRSYLIQDQNGSRVLYINNDLAMVDQSITTRVLETLASEYGAHVYNSSNVMISATHTHSGPGGFLQYLLYTLTAKGFVHQNFNLICDGIVRSVRKAHERITSGRIYFNEGDLINKAMLEQEELAN